MDRSTRGLTPDLAVLGDVPVEALVADRHLGLGVVGEEVVLVAGEHVSCVVHLPAVCVRRREGLRALEVCRTQKGEQCELTLTL